MKSVVYLPPGPGSFNEWNKNAFEHFPFAHAHNTKFPHSLILLPKVSWNDISKRVPSLCSPIWGKWYIYENNAIKIQILYYKQFSEQFSKNDAFIACLLFREFPFFLMKKRLMVMVSLIKWTKYMSRHYTALSGTWIYNVVNEYHFFDNSDLTNIKQLSP